MGGWLYIYSIWINQSMDNFFIFLCYRPYRRCNRRMIKKENGIALVRQSRFARNDIWGLLFYNGKLSCFQGCIVIAKDSIGIQAVGIAGGIDFCCHSS